jgi:predicted nucleic acid-binding protein
MRGSTTILVVADTSPLNYLIQIDCQELLTTLYQRVLIPGAVLGELMHVRTPAKVRAWLRSRPAWLEVREVAPSSDPALARLDPREREAIQLAQEEHADLLLIDERSGANLAQRLGMEVTGTLGVLLQAARIGLIDIDAALDELQATDFRCTSQLLQQVKRSAQERNS